MDPKYIEALGHFLAYYKSDLIYFLNFKRFKDKKISIDDYLNKIDHNFSNFLNDYRVARNIPVGRKKDFLLKMMEWLAKNPIGTDVDGFATRMQPMTHRKIMTSLCSKVLMLNAPHLIIPIDAYTKNALNHNTNQYYIYNQKTQEFRAKTKTELDVLTKQVQEYIDTIEAPFVNKLTNIKDIRELRLTDKILWCSGKKS